MADSMRLLRSFTVKSTVESDWLANKLSRKFYQTFRRDFKFEPTNCGPHLWLGMLTLDASVIQTLDFKVRSQTSQANT